MNLSRLGLGLLGKVETVLQELEGRLKIDVVGNMASKSHKCQGRRKAFVR